MAEGISRGNAAELQHAREKCPTALFYWISGVWAGRTWHSTPHRGAQPHHTDTFNFFFFFKKAILIDVREVSCCFLSGINVLGVILAEGVHQAASRNLVSSSPAASGPGFCSSGACFGRLGGGEQHDLTTVSCG